MTWALRRRVFLVFAIPALAGCASSAPGPVQAGSQGGPARNLAVPPHEVTITLQLSDEQTGVALDRALVLPIYLDATDVPLPGAASTDGGRVVDYMADPVTYTRPQSIVLQHPRFEVRDLRATGQRLEGLIVLVPGYQAEYLSRVGMRAVDGRDVSADVTLPSAVYAAAALEPARDRDVTRRNWLDVIDPSRTTLTEGQCEIRHIWFSTTPQRDTVELRMSDTGRRIARDFLTP